MRSPTYCHVCMCCAAGGKVERVLLRETTLGKFGNLVLGRCIFAQLKYNLQKLLVSNIDLIATDTIEPSVKLFLKADIERSVFRAWETS